MFALSTGTSTVIARARWKVKVRLTKLPGTIRAPRTKIRPSVARLSSPPGGIVVVPPGVTFSEESLPAPDTPRSESDFLWLLFTRVAMTVPLPLAPETTRALSTSTAPVRSSTPAEGLYGWSVCSPKLTVHEDSTGTASARTAAARRRRAFTPPSLVVGQGPPTPGPAAVDDAPEGTRIGLLSTPKWPLTCTNANRLRIAACYPGLPRKGYMAHDIHRRRNGCLPESRRCDHRGDRDAADQGGGQGVPRPPHRGSAGPGRAGPGLQPGPGGGPRRCRQGWSGSRLRRAARRAHGGADELAPPV